MRFATAVLACAFGLAGAGGRASADDRTPNRRPTGAAAAAPLPRPRPAGPRRFVFDRVAAPGLRPRRVTVVVPRDYDRGDRARRFGVVYAHDGQVALGGGLEISRAVDELTGRGAIEPWIVVAIDTTAQRTAELTTWVDRTAALLLDVVKPLVDARFRTLADAAHTALVGYSYGGLATLRIGIRHADRVGRLVCMSSSFWWAGHRAERELSRHGGPMPQRLWIDVGLREPGGSPVPYMVADARAVRDEAMRKGMALGRDLAYIEEPGAEHGHAWGGLRMTRALAFMLRE